MIIKADRNTCFVFDLDDTLYSEIDFLKSAYREIAIYTDRDNTENVFSEMLKIYMEGGNSFDFLINSYPSKGFSRLELLEMYRNHIPDINLREGVNELFNKLKSKGCTTGLVTNGRSITQRNKLKALGLEGRIDTVAISEEFGTEKPNISIFRFIQESHADCIFYYFADNLLFDFFAPKKLGWCCVGVLNLENIHKPVTPDLKREYFPHLFIESFTEIEII